MALLEVKHPELVTIMLAVVVIMMPVLKESRSRSPKTNRIYFSITSN